MTKPSLISTRIRRASRSARRSSARSIACRTSSVAGFAAFSTIWFTTYFTPVRLRTARSRPHAGSSVSTVPSRLTHPSVTVEAIRSPARRVPFERLPYRVGDLGVGTLEGGAFGDAVDDLRSGRAAEHAAGMFRSGRRSPPGRCSAIRRTSCTGASARLTIIAPLDAAAHDAADRASPLRRHGDQIGSTLVRFPENLCDRIAKAHHVLDVRRFTELDRGGSQHTRHLLIGVGGDPTATRAPSRCLRWWPSVQPGCHSRVLREPFLGRRHCPAGTSPPHVSRGFPSTGRSAAAPAALRSRFALSAPDRWRARWHMKCSTPLPKEHLRRGR